MSADITIRQNTTRPIISITLREPDSFPADLTTATSVVFTMRDQLTKAIVRTGSCTFTANNTGKAQYHWTLTDTSVDGWYNADFLVTYADGTSECYPDNRFLTVLIEPAL